jgi:hypothetical protein
MPYWPLCSSSCPFAALTAGVASQRLRLAPPPAAAGVASHRLPPPPSAAAEGVASHRLPPLPPAPGVASHWLGAGVRPRPGVASHLLTDAGVASTESQSDAGLLRLLLAQGAGGGARARGGVSGPSAYGPEAWRAAPAV